MVKSKSKITLCCWARGCGMALKPINRLGRKARQRTLTRVCPGCKRANRITILLGGAIYRHCMGR